MERSASEVYQADKVASSLYSLEHGERKDRDHYFVNKMFIARITSYLEYCKDIVATIDLINKITKIEKSRGSEDQSQKIVSVGSEADIRFVFEETYSELLQLCLICDDAEIYPELKNQINKTPAIEKRTRLLSQILMKKGFFPNILDLDEDQQLYTINEILRNMVKLTDKQSKVESYRAVIDQLESNSFEIENFFFPDTKNIVDTVLKVEFNVEEDV